MLCMKSFPSDIESLSPKSKYDMSSSIFKKNYEWKFFLHLGLKPQYRNFEKLQCNLSAHQILKTVNMTTINTEINKRWIKTG